MRSMLRRGKGGKGGAGSLAMAVAVGITLRGADGFWSGAKPLSRASGHGLSSRGLKRSSSWLSSTTSPGTTNSIHSLAANRGRRGGGRQGRIRLTAAEEAASAGGGGGGAAAGVALSNRAGDAGIEGSAPGTSDYSAYFSAYAILEHQMQMLTDQRRMDSYYSAMMKNRHLIEGKTVLDIGTGSGILALWAAKAGAKKVIAVEFTSMAKHAKELIRANGFEDVVEVLQCKVEDLDLPEQVDIIVSEWMGYILLRESMLDSVIKARDKWLKPDGIMMPSHATISWGIVDHRDKRESKEEEYRSCLEDWSGLVQKVKDDYGSDLSVLNEAFDDEQWQYYIMSSSWESLDGNQLVSKPSKLVSWDLKTCTLEDTAGITPTDFSFVTWRDTAEVSAFAAWFSVDFKGGEDVRPVTLDTAPEERGTHWGQQVFWLKDPLRVPKGSTIQGRMSLFRQQENPRLYMANVKHSVFPKEEGAPSASGSDGVDGVVDVGEEEEGEAVSSSIPAVADMTEFDVDALYRVD